MFEIESFKGRSSLGINIIKIEDIRDILKFTKNYSSIYRGFDKETPEELALINKGVENEIWDTIEKYGKDWGSVDIITTNWIIIPKGSTYKWPNCSSMFIGVKYHDGNILNFEGGSDKWKC